MSARPRVIVHVDMDAFFASVEELDDPRLAGRPVLVGGLSGRGVVAAASYAARRFGCRSAMPMVQALRLCPEAIVVPPRHGRYAEVSRAVFAIFERFTPEVEGLSLDEAFLDVTGSVARFGDGATIARTIKSAIRDELALTASAGVASGKFVAKIASDAQKPDGLCVVAPGEERSFLGPMPVERMWGMGEKTAALARAHGFRTLSDLAAADDAGLLSVFGNHGPRMGRLARGEDDRIVEPDRGAKSIGAEETFERDLTAADEVHRALLGQAMRVSARLADTRLAARVVHLKLKHHDFTLLTRQTTLREPAFDADTLYGAAKAAFDRLDLRWFRLRLTGVSASGLVSADAARTLFEEEVDTRRRSLETARAALRGRFGETAITRASLLDGAGDRVKPLAGTLNVKARGPGRA